MKPVAYGIDVGTTNSSIAVAYDDGSVAVVDPEFGTSLMPSLVYLHRDRNRIAGSPALRSFLDVSTAKTSCGSCTLTESCRQMRPAGWCLNSRLLSQVKSSMSDDSFNVTHSWGIDFELEDLMATVISSLKRAADRFLSADIKKVALGHPVRFHGADGADHQHRQDLAESRLRAAGERAGFTDIVLVPESQAAVAIDEIDSGVVLCTDFGGGTFDVAVIDVVGSSGRILSLDGVPVGGEEFSAKIFDGVVRPVLGLDDLFTRLDGQTRRLPAGMRMQMRSLAGLRVLLADADAVGILAEFAGRGNNSLLLQIHELLYGGQAWTFYQAIEEAKVRLSYSDATFIDYQRSWIDLHVPISRTQFEALIFRDLLRVRACIEDALHAARVDAEEIAFVTKTGGSSQLPSFDRLIREIFPEAHVIVQDAFTTVVKGLADFAGEEFAP